MRGRKRATAVRLNLTAEETRFRIESTAVPMNRQHGGASAAPYRERYRVRVLRQTRWRASRLTKGLEVTKDEFFVRREALRRARRSRGLPGGYRTGTL